MKINAETLDLASANFEKGHVPTVLVSLRCGDFVGTRAVEREVHDDKVDVRFTPEMLAEHELCKSDIHDITPVITAVTRF